MASTRSEIRREIELTRTSLDRKISALEDLVSGKIDAVKNSVDLQHQVRRHPWAMVGVAAFVGYVFRKLFGKLFSRSHRRLPPPAQPPMVRQEADGGSFWKGLLGSIGGIVLRDLARRLVSNINWPEQRRSR